MPNPFQLVAGAVFARDFRVTRELGSGGMGVVFEVEQLSTGMQRALKLMRPELLSDEKARKQFGLEARVGSMVKSHHIVKIVDAGVDRDTSIPWLAMELLDGVNLRAFVDAGERFDLPSLLGLFRQLCHGLAAAHEARIIHRDLKPENVFLAKSDIEGLQAIVKILDFGIAKFAHGTSDATRAVGTLEWLAPEQTGAGRLSPAADVWALGLLAFYLSTGRSFWKSANVPDKPVFGVMQELLFAQIPAPSERASDIDGASEFPASLDAWFLRCVDRDPAKRYEHARAAYDAMRDACGLSAERLELSSVRSTPSAALIAGVSSTTIPLAGVTKGAYAPRRRFVVGAAAALLLGVGAATLLRLRPGAVPAAPATPSPPVASTWVVHPAPAPQPSAGGGEHPVESKRLSIVAGTAAQGARITVIVGDERWGVSALPAALDVPDDGHVMVMAEKRGFATYLAAVSFADGSSEKTVEIDLAALDESSQSKTKSTDGRAASTPARTPDIEFLRRELARAAQQVRSDCKLFGGFRGAGKAEVRFAEDGQAKHVAVSIPNGAEADCVARVFGDARLPPFDGDDIIVTKTFEIPDSVPLPKAENPF